MPITHIVLRNDEPPKITREQIGSLQPPFHTSLVNPDFAAFAQSCGGAGFRIDDPDDLEPVLRAALAVTDGPSMVQVRTAGKWV